MHDGVERRGEEREGEGRYMMRGEGRCMMGLKGGGEIHDRERWKWRRGLWDGQLCCSLSADFSSHVAT